jgi:hypothetical protein
MNLLARGKRKFVFQSHIDKKTRRPSLFPIQKSEQFAKPITSKLRQAVKPGRNRIDPAGEAASFPTAKHSIREGIPKRAAVFFPFRSLLS